MSSLSAWRIVLCQNQIQQFILTPHLRVCFYSTIKGIKQAEIKNKGVTWSGLSFVYPSHVLFQVRLSWLLILNMILRRFGGYSIKNVGRAIGKKGGWGFWHFQLDWAEGVPEIWNRQGGGSTIFSSLLPLGECWEYVCSDTFASLQALRRRGQELSNGILHAYVE